MGDVRVPPPAARCSSTSADASSAGAAAAVAATAPPCVPGEDGTSSPSGEAQKCSFAEGVLGQLKGELRQCGDVTRLLEGATLAVHLSGEPHCWEAAMQSVLVLLVNKVPKVRVTPRGDTSG